MTYGNRSKMRTHASNPTWKRLRRDKEQELDRAAKQAARRARKPADALVWADAPRHCTTCGRGLSDRYRRWPHLRRKPGRKGERGWCPAWPGEMPPLVEFA